MSFVRRYNLRFNVALWKLRWFTCAWSGHFATGATSPYRKDYLPFSTAMQSQLQAAVSISSLEGVTSTMTNYNSNSVSQRNTVEASLALIRKAARHAAKTAIEAFLILDSNATGFEIRIADFGCSHGVNSLAPIAVMLSEFESFLPQNDTSFVTYHVDVPSNDFTQIMTLLTTSPDSYMFDKGKDGVATERENVFPAMVGRSFFGRCFPVSHLNAAFSFNAMQWLSTRPSQVQNAIVYLPERANSRQQRSEWSRCAHEDLTRFLKLRAVEIRPGGTIVISAVGMPEEPAGGASADTLLVPRVMNVLFDWLVADGTLTEAELAAMTMPTYFRTPSEFLSAENAVSDLFVVLQESFTKQPDGFWHRYTAGEITKTQCAHMATGWMLAITESSIRAGFRQVGKSDGEVEAGIARVKEGMTRYFETERKEGWSAWIWTAALKRTMNEIS